MTYNNVNPDLLNKWTKVAEETLVGKKIVGVRFLSDEEMEGNGWYKRPLCFILDDGTICVVAADDEGNNGGALFTNDKNGNDTGGIPTLYNIR